MSILKIHDKTFAPYLTVQQIQEGVAKVAEKINADYKDKTPIFIGMLNGAFMFASDVIRRFEGECEVAFVRLRSYHGTASSGRVEVVTPLPSNLEGRHIVILEDIVDSGETMSVFLPMVQGENPASVEICTLLFKPSALQKPIAPKYNVFEIPNDFVVGYGLDYDGHGRNLPEIYVVSTTP